MFNFEITTNMQHMDDGDYLVDFYVNDRIIASDLIHESILLNDELLQEYLIKVFEKGVDRGE